MITPEQAGQVADTLLDEPRKDLERNREKREAAESSERRRRESPMFPAFIAAITVTVALGYLDNTLACVALGTIVGGLFGWAARRSSTT